MERQRYCKRLIEVDLPIRRISAHAIQEKAARRGHVPKIHVWPATRPPAACRAIICASLWPDPVDKNCSDEFKLKAKDYLRDWVKSHLSSLTDSQALARFLKIRKSPEILDDDKELRETLIDIIAEYANPDMAVSKKFLLLIRNITKAACNFGNNQNEPFTVSDPFSGSGTISLEALRTGVNAISGEINPVALLFNEVILKHIPKQRDKLISVLGKWVKYIEEAMEKDLKEYYVSSAGEMPTAFLWARTILSEAPDQDKYPVEVPLIRSMCLSKKSKAPRGLRFVRDKSGKVVTEKFEILYCNGEKITVRRPLLEVVKDKKLFDKGTVARGSVTCPVTGYTTPVGSVRKQLNKRSGGAQDARLYAVVYDKVGQTRDFRMPNNDDLRCYEEASKRLKELIGAQKNNKSIIPEEPIPLMSGVFNAPIYGHRTWESLFNHRQLLFFTKFTTYLSEIPNVFNGLDKELLSALQASACLLLDNLLNHNAALCLWQQNTPNATNVFTRWALPMVWDFAEINPVAGAGGSPTSMGKKFIQGLNQLLSADYLPGTVLNQDAANQLLPDDSVDAVITDPPYYNAIPYADISDYFYVWLKRVDGIQPRNSFLAPETPKEKEIVEMSGWDPIRYGNKDKQYFEDKICAAFQECRRVLKPNGLAVIVFAHKATSAWESLLNATINAGWIITSSWPIDTEMTFRMRGKNSAALNSSVHLVCRPRENLDGSLRMDEIGDWRDVLQELPRRIHEWMPRLAKEGVVGADAIFSCLGPALEIFSQYSQVEKANGDRVELREYLEHVWAAVAKEALNMIFKGAHTEGFEEDSRLTAMWLWTLSTSANGNGKEKDVSTADEDENGSSKAAVSSGFSLEFDAARKIAQGLGAHLEKLSDLIEIKGDEARLLPVSERVKSLFGKDSTAASTYKRKKKEKQLTLFDELKTVQEDWSLGDTKAEVGKTVLDRLHQSMILFGAGRGEALRRFLVEEGVGKDERFWQLAQALSALYPSSTDEKRWVDGVLARKKGLGF